LPPAKDSMTHARLQILVAELTRGVRFLAVGLGGLATDSLVFLLLHGEGAGKPTARAVSLICATLVTWTLNRLFTFAASGRSRRAELGRYGLVALGAQGFNYVLFLSLCAMAPHVPPIAFLLVSAVCATAFSYTGQRLFTFNAAPARAA
jgi:putative flippase GtrA